MPELPEVETVCRGLSKNIKGKTIGRVTLRRKDLRIPFPPALKRLKNIQIKNIDRRAKYIQIHLANHQTLLIHLGMSGRILIQKKSDPTPLPKHSHMTLYLTNGDHVTLCDPRRFGMVDLTRSEKLNNHRFFNHLGPEPFDTNFNAAYLFEKFQNKKVPIKVAIMDQRIVVGVGNIYAAEALYRARLHPERPASDLSKAELKKFITAIRYILDKAIEAGGSSLRDYVQTDGSLGYFQNLYFVYGRDGEPCKGCKPPKALISKITQGGRSTFYCPLCQK